jgi:alpha-tubulin suppressor-like RCC1 family protein
MRAAFSLVLLSALVASCSQDTDFFKQLAPSSTEPSQDQNHPDGQPGFPARGDADLSQPGGIRSLSVGEHHSCVIWDGGVHCWGYGLAGQLGQGDFQNQAEPVFVEALGLDNIAVATGDLHSCAIKASGEVYCWGYNQTGAVGNGKSGREYAFSGQAKGNNVTQPSLVQGLTGVPIVQVAATKSTTCALAQSGDVYCWGSGSSYELGDGQMESLQNRYNHHTGVAQKVTVLPEKAKSIHAGDQAFCALTVMDRVICWGKLTLPTEKDYPVVDLSPGRPTLSLTLADQHACFVSDKNELYCIGDNWYQQTGLSSIVSTWTRVNGESFTRISTARKTTCGITPNRTVRCWGVCLHGLCGTQFAAKLVSPTQAQNVFAYSTQKSIEIEGISGAVEISVGARHACALLDSGTIRCWGNGFLGELGHGESRSSAEPMAVNL